MVKYQASERCSRFKALKGFTKLIKEITIAAKIGGGDIDFN